MAEAVRGYPRWEGALSHAPRALVIARREMERVVRNQWGRSILILAFGYAVLIAGNLWTLRETPSIHTTAALVAFMEQLSWAGLGLAAVAAGPALLEDAQRGALELYHSRAVTRWDYLAGKSLAVVALAMLVVSGPGLVYWAGSFLAFEAHPDGWVWAWLGILGWGAIWALVVAGAGLGLSALSRSSRAATLILLGAVALLDILFGRVLSALTRDQVALVLSPLAGLAQQAVWLFPGTEPRYEFTWWWALIALGALFAAGWTAVALRHPRPKGVE